MDKPDWKDAPEWAKYLAQDKDGEWYWFECRPEMESECWYLSKYVGQTEKASKEAWERTLEPRP